jgi:D-threonate/D-erythronate kinase
VLRLHVIADDLTGACDVAAALLPWPGGVTVLPDGTARAATPPGGLVVRNTQSRTLPPAEAAARVRATLAAMADGTAEVLLKKIDTGLRGPLGAEIDAALDSLDAPRAFVLPAIPEVGRTTVGGEQRIDGVPVHRTAFARDPQNPVRDGQVSAVIAATARRPAASIGLEAVRRPGGVRAALAACAAPITVFDAETDGDLAAAVRALLDEPTPLVLVGSTGLARALRGALPVDDAPPIATAAPASAGVLVVAGSVHPAARDQCAHAERAGLLAAVIEVAAAGGEDAGQRAARVLGSGRAVALVAPGEIAAGSETAIGVALRAAAVTALAGARPAGVILVGGETAFHVLAGLDHPPLAVESRPSPLAMQGRIAGGPHRGLAVVTKGGSSGEEALLATLVRLVQGGG